MASISSAAVPEVTHVCIRALAAADKPRWRQMFHDYIEWYKTSVPDNVIELTWQHLMAGGEGNHFGLVAETPEGNVIGLAHVLFHASTWSATGYAYLEDLYVAPEGRGCGAGRALIEATYREADARKCSNVYWVTQESNYRARALYDKMGTKTDFVQYRRS